MERMGTLTVEGEGELSNEDHDKQAKSLRVRFRALVPSLWLHDESFEFPYPDISVHVVLRSLPEIDGKPVMGTECEAIREIKPPDEILQMFRSLAANKMPEGSKINTSWPANEYMDAHSRLIGKFNGLLEFCPEPLLTYVSQIAGELLYIAARTVQLLRWRYGIDGPYSPFSEGAMT